LAEKAPNPAIIDVATLSVTGGAKPTLFWVIRTTTTPQLLQFAVPFDCFLLSMTVGNTTSVGIILSRTGITTFNNGMNGAESGIVAAFIGSTTAKGFAGRARLFLNEKLYIYVSAGTTDTFLTVEPL
jgi:hypothetical protein